MRMISCWWSETKGLARSRRDAAPSRPGGRAPRERVLYSTEQMLPRTFMATSTHPASSLTSPLTRRSLDAIKSTLVQAFESEKNQYDPAERHAAVLVPFCNVKDRPGILLEVRGSKLRTHSGEVRCETIQRNCLHGTEHALVAFQGVEWTRSGHCPKRRTSYSRTHFDRKTHLRRQQLCEKRKKR